MEIVSNLNENNNDNNSNFDQEEDRFIKDLEFIQNLSNAAYLHCKLLSFIFFSFIFLFVILYFFSLDLARNQYFDDPCFLNYLKYLRYWKEPEYIIYIQLVYLFIYLFIHFNLF